MRKKCKFFSLLLTLVFLFSLVGNVSAQSSSTVTKPKVSIEDAMKAAYDASYDVKNSTLEVERDTEDRDDKAEDVTFIPEGGMITSTYQATFLSWQKAQITLDSAKKTAQTAKDDVNSDVVAAYVLALKSRNNVESDKISLDTAKQQRRIASLAANLGMVSDYDMKTYDDSITKLETALKSSEATYQSAIAALGVLMGIKDASWNPEFTSKPVLNNYKRDEVAIEITRGTANSPTVSQKQALLDIEKGKQPWILLGVSDETKRINLQEASNNYQQATYDVASAIQSAYYAIDVQEKDIAAKAEALTKAENDLKIAKIKFDAGLLPRYSSSAAVDNLYSYEKAVDTAKLKLENSRLDLAKSKASFALLTGQKNEVYSAADWK